MMQHATHSTNRGVICLFCETPTPLPATVATREAQHPSEGSSFGISLIRCRQCGKEAPYGPGDILDLSEARIPSPRRSFSHHA